jgi:putative oligomerization/nucleic acid binding protein
VSNLVIFQGEYLGGPPAFSAAQKASNVSFMLEGVHFARWATYLVIPWEQIIDIEIDGPEQAQQRFTATRLALLGPLGLAFKKDVKATYLTFVTNSGDVIFKVDFKTTHEVRGELSAIIAANCQRYRTPVETPAAPVETEVADPITQLERLAALRDRGVLSEDEFQSQKQGIIASNRPSSGESPDSVHVHQWISTTNAAGQVVGRCTICGTYDRSIGV